MNSMITREDALRKAENDDYCWMIGNFLVCYGSPSSKQHYATVHLINGCKYLIGEISLILGRQFPKSIHVSICDKNILNVKHIDLEWSEMEFVWLDHDEEFNIRVIKTLKTLSLV